VEEVANSMTTEEGVLRSSNDVYKKKARCCMGGGMVEVEQKWERGLCYLLTLKYLSVGSTTTSLAKSLPMQSIEPGHNCPGYRY